MHFVEELDNLLRVSTKEPLLKPVRQQRVAWEPVGGRCLYCSIDPPEQAGSASPVAEGSDKNWFVPADSASNRVLMEELHSETRVTHSRGPAVNGESRNLTDKQRARLSYLERLDLRSNRACVLEEIFGEFCNYGRKGWARRFLTKV